LLSTSHFQSLCLVDIPDASYISPQGMVTVLVIFPKLESLMIGFQPSLSRPFQIAVPILTRILLPSLVYLHPVGVSEYLEDFVARIDTPELRRLVIFFSVLVFDVS